MKALIVLLFTFSCTAFAGGMLIKIQLPGGEVKTFNSRDAEEITIGEFVCFNRFSTSSDEMFLSDVSTTGCGFKDDKSMTVMQGRCTYAQPKGPAFGDLILRAQNGKQSVTRFIKKSNKDKDVWTVSFECQ